MSFKFEKPIIILRSRVQIPVLKLANLFAEHKKVGIENLHENKIRFKVCVEDKSTKKVKKRYKKYWFADLSVMEQQTLFELAQVRVTG